MVPVTRASWCLEICVLMVSSLSCYLAAVLQQCTVAHTLVPQIMQSHIIWHWPALSCIAIAADSFVYLDREF